MNVRTYMHAHLHMYVGINKYVHTYKHIIRADGYLHTYKFSIIGHMKSSSPISAALIVTPSLLQISM